MHTTRINADFVEFLLKFTESSVAVDQSPSSTQGSLSGKTGESGQRSQRKRVVSVTTLDGPQEVRRLCCRRLTST